MVLTLHAQTFAPPRKTGIGQVTSTPKSFLRLIYHSVFFFPVFFYFLFIHLLWHLPPLPPLPPSRFRKGERQRQEKRERKSKSERERASRVTSFPGISLSLSSQLWSQFLSFSDVDHEKNHSQLSTGDDRDGALFFVLRGSWFLTACGGECA